MAVEAEGDAAVLGKLRELLAETPDLGYRAAHAALQAEETFKAVGLKRVQKLLREVREGSPAGRAKPAPATATPVAAPKLVTPVADAGTSDLAEVIICRPNIECRFGMMIDTERSPLGGHAVTEIRSGGVVEAWNAENPALALRTGDIITAVNGKTTFDAIMGEFRDCLSCTLRVLRRSGEEPKPALREDRSEAEKEAKAMEMRKARVTAALIPGLIKIVDSEFGQGAGGRIGRVVSMYERVGRNEVFEEDGEHGKKYAPGYIEGLSPVLPFHRTQDYPWCAELRSQWKSIRKELWRCLDEDLWTPGAYDASNEAYGKDWKIMGVLTEDRWQDENRFKITTAAMRSLKGVKLFEVFFAKMPPHTKIAPHSDNLSYILTSHLALELEEGACSIQVGNEERYWKEGEMLVLDTTFIHSTKNESSRPRYILVVRFWHPGLTEEERRAIHVSHAILAGAAKK